MSIKFTYTRQVHTHWSTPKIQYLHYYYSAGVQNLTGISWGCSCTSTSCSRSSASCSGKNRQGSTSVTSLKNCNIPNVTTNTTYLAVLPPVLNIFPVSCTLEAQQMEIAIGEKCFKLGLCVIFRCTWYWAYIMLVLFHDISHTELTPTRYWMQGKTLLTTSSKDFWDGNKGSHWNPKQFIIEITPSRVSHYNQSCKHAQSWILIQVTISMGKLMTSRSLRSAPFTKQVCSSLKYIPNTW